MTRANVILDFIKKYIATNGFPPSILDIMTGAEVSSSSVVFYHLQKLELQGKIRRTPNTPRSIVVLDGNGGSPASDDNGKEE